MYAKLPRAILDHPLAVRARRILLDPGSLTEKSLGAVFWSGAAFAANAPMRLVSNLITTRLLMPDAFALMATVGLVHAMVGLISTVGIGQSIVRSHRGEEELFLQVAWVMKILRSIIIALIIGLVALALWIFGPEYARPDTVYADPVLPQLLVGMMVLVVIGGFGSNKPALAGRRFAQRLLLPMSVATMATQTVVSVLGAWITGSVWGLFAGMFAASIVQCALSHTILPGPKMRLRWDRDISSEIWHYGKWLIPSSIGGFLAQNGDRLIFSFLLDKTLFGLYSVALIWGQLVGVITTRIGNPMLLPSLSALVRRGHGDIGRPFAKVMLAFGGLALAITIAILVFTAYGFQILYEPPFDDARHFVAILAVKAFLFSVFKPVQNLLLAHGDSKALSSVQMLRGISVMALVWAGYELAGLEAALLMLILAPTPAILWMISHEKVREAADFRLLAGLVVVVDTAAITWYMLGTDGLSALTAAASASSGG